MTAETLGRDDLREGVEVPHAVLKPNVDEPGDNRG